MTGIRTFLRRWLFQKEELEIEARLLALRAMEEKARSVDIVELARLQLSGFAWGSLDRAYIDAIIKNEMPSCVHTLPKDEQQDFLRNIKDLHDNQALGQVLDYLTRVQIIFGNLGTRNVEELNFSRATVNGLRLLAEEIEDNYGIYKKQSEAEEEYDTSEIMG